jgi:putative ABC transport system permease protein
MRLVVTLSVRDLLHERRLTICSVAALAAVLTPLILLFGLKNGLVEGLRTELIENPRTRTIVNSSNRTYDDAFLARLAARPDVAFLAPRLRTLNNEARFEQPGRPGQVRRGELLASGPGDPLLASMPPPDGQDIVLSAGLAARLGALPGMQMTMRVPRGRDQEILSLPVVVTGIAPAGAFARDAAFVALPILLLVDDFVDGRLPATATPADVELKGRVYAGFRAHARRLEDVPVLDRFLRDQDVDVETHAAEVAGLLGLERNLNMLFALLAALGAAGFLVSLGAGLYASVERKQRELSLLRLVGLMRRSVVLLPILQSAMVGLAGSAAAAIVALVGAGLLNQLPLVGGTSAGRPVCIVEPWHLLVATAISIAGAVVAAGFAGRRAAAILPAEGLAHA